MQDKINILNELKEADAALLVKVGNKNYFYVPDNYFNDLPGNIVAQIFVKSLPHTNPFIVPAGYFENLPDNILEKINVKKIQDPNTDKTNPFTVPEGYFNNLADNILKKIKSSDTGSVQQELEEIALLLSKIPKTNVYSVPENYFERANPLAAINVQPKAKVISIGSKTRKWISYAAAACIAFVLFGGGYLYFNDKQQPVVTSYAKTDVQKGISALSDDEIANYLKDNNNMGMDISVDEDQQQNMEIQNLLNNVSDEEIQQYLNQDPESGKRGGI